MPAEASTYKGLRFSFAAMEHEIENMRLLARPFLTPKSFEQVIPQWKEELRSLKHNPTAALRTWTLAENNPIQTKLSEGHYEPGRREGGLHVYGTLSATWGIRAERRGNRSSRTAEFFMLCGIASTKIRVWSEEDEEDPVEVARWTLEVGDQRSPGCHFHTQIDLDPEDRKFPEALSVPRFPGYLHTPMDALDYLIGELFQDKWYECTSAESDSVRNWNGCQKPRLVKLLEWHRQKFNEATGSPWATFKRQKPQEDLFFD
jgi:hypothetical protein